MADHVVSAKDVLLKESSSIRHAADRLDGTFNDLIEAILHSDSRVVVCGMGKSGHIAKKIFATFVSTGTPSMFLHPAEAFHGDLGMILSQDIVIAISNSGETEEVLKLIPFLKDNDNLIISLTGNPKSTLARSSDYHIDVGVQEEACPLQLAPTSSTTVTLAMGDALAVSLMKARNFQPENFARFHPGGSLGKKLLGKVNDFGVSAVTVSEQTTFKDILSAMSNAVCGVICVVEDGTLKGVITDGDVRRQLSEEDLGNVVGFTAADIMSTNPRVVDYNTRCRDADQIMIDCGVNSLVFKDSSGHFKIYNNLNR